MISELQISSIMSLQNAGSKAGRRGFHTAAFGLIARMPVSRQLDQYQGVFHCENRQLNRSCQSAAVIVWQAQSSLWENNTPAFLSVRCDFDVASVKIALGQKTRIPVSPRGGCVASAAAALGSQIP